MPPSLDGQIAVVTGGSSGIGRATALLLAREGATVFVGDFDPVPANGSESRELGIVELRCDVRREEDVCNLMQTAQARGPIRILVCNAGIGLVKQIPDVSLAEWSAVLETNLTGAFLCCKHAIPSMRAAGGGAIINVASNAGLLPRAHDPVYSTSKGALIAFTKSLALCHASDRIRVNAVCPGPVGQTRMMESDLIKAPNRAAAEQQYISASPLAKAHQRMISPDEVAQAILYLASDAALMVTGSSIAIDGGKSLGVPPKSLSS